MQSRIFRRSLMLASLVALTGCTQEGLQPSYLGLRDITTDAMASPAVTPRKTPEALRHVQSNKVLGAMAFQKVTGRTVDPARLSDRN